MHRLSPFALTVILLLQQGCTPILDHRGRQWRPDAEVALQPEHRLSQDNLVELMGRPSFTSTFGEEKWYYVMSEMGRSAFFAPHIREFTMLEISFDGKNCISSMKKYGQEILRDVPYFEKVTPTVGHSASFLEQVFGNFGRIRKAATGDTK